MDDPIRTTRQTYDRVAPAFLANTRDRSRGAARMREFASRLTPGARVLDLGAGPGCDTALLRAHGLQAVAVDLSLGMLRAGAAEFPGPRVQADLRALPFETGSADGLWANACLLHLAPDDLRAALAEMTRVARGGAFAHLSVKKGDGACWETRRYDAPRWFQYWTGPELDAVLAEAGLPVVSAAEEATRRDEWLIRLVRVPAARFPYHELATPRLRLRRPVPDDAPAVFAAWGADPEVTRFLGWRPHASAEEAERALAGRLGRLAEGEELSWLLEVEDEPGAVGVVSVWIEGSEAELGFALARRHWGRGLTTEAVGAVLEWLRGETDATRVWATCDAENPASARVLEKAGLVARGRFERDVVRPNLSPVPRPTLLFERP